MVKIMRIKYSYEIETFTSEEDMCKKFWKLILDYQKHKLMDEYSIFCVSNNQRTGKAWGQAKDKAIGVVAGVADYAVAGDRFLEAKVRRFKQNPPRKDGTRTSYIEEGEQSPEQKEFEQAVIKRGGDYRIFYTPSEGIEILKEWGLIK